VRDLNLIPSPWHRFASYQQPEASHQQQEASYEQRGPSFKQRGVSDEQWETLV
jgi:hypothetical protein